MKPSQQHLFLQIDQNKGPQPYVSTRTTHTPKYLDQFLMVLFETFTTGLGFARQSKQGAATLCFDQIPHYLKYLDQFLTVLLETFKTWLILARQSKQGDTTQCFDQNYPSIVSQK